MHKVLTVIAGIVIIIMMAVMLLILVLQLTDYRPPSFESTVVRHAEGVQAVQENTAYDIATFNIGYCGLGADEDFFMDGGIKSKPDDLDTVLAYYQSIESYLDATNADWMILQEVDIHSDRTYDFDAYQALQKHFAAMSANFAYNYKVLFVPVPWPPMGQVNAGQATFSSFDMADGERLALPSDYAWPQKLVMLDRCVAVTRYAIENSDHQLIIMNAHFSAYDDGTLRAAQMAVVKTYMEKAYKEGNYVILGGDFNQTFPSVDMNDFPLFENGKYYKPYQIEADWTPVGWQWAIDNTAPTYRLLNASYQPDITQVGIIDGFLVSPNVRIVDVKTDDLGFEASDHNPVRMSFELIQ
ncbi:endonuclease/exonuclease/phosphatase family protein [Fusibacter paucivorans]|uniref:Endonuclease/exonuclease/phosphatase family protein n=1 Tax=Fusibacter paucivorans TaxID=76009 RepID=A0ABS5PU25_9FIRM|nr:endonuclease/exonuclease/phosphatase family protein [Fusibacter paucivorans]MBS7528668.1 endonuclease/exonuclease/phosphatase family protein [Fusibacter paucivorans]